MPLFDEAGIARFQDIISRLEALLAKLLAAPSKPRSEHGTIPQVQGVYLFSEDGNPMYVGQTRKLRNRLRAHTVPSSSQEQASFAFLLAKEEAEKQGMKTLGSRKETANHEEFRPMFIQAKRRVAEMDVRFIALAEPDLRTIFEVYAALVLGTSRYNSFETH